MKKKFKKWEQTFVTDLKPLPTFQHPTFRSWKGSESNAVTRNET